MQRHPPGGDQATPGDAPDQPQHHPVGGRTRVLQDEVTGVRCGLLPQQKRLPVLLACSPAGPDETHAAREVPAIFFGEH